MVCSHQSRLLSALDILRVHEYVKYVYVDDRDKSQRRSAEIRYWPHNHSWDVTLSAYNVKNVRMQ